MVRILVGVHVMRCRSCLAEIAEGGRFCSTCGEPVEPPESTPTETVPPRSGPPAGKARRVSGSSPLSDSHASTSVPDQGRFLPGTVLADRYRIVGLLGRGGMGEVYRADDLRLGQAVALKFLPEELTGDAASLDRFRNEVRIARQVSHPSVCRVYDIGEVDGQVFYTMEYVDGEDLSSLLRRIGRLPQDKAIQIARQICAGLAAAHDRGVLHRDLKPANVMVDGRGRARITDFGLAGLAHEMQGADLRSGTPAYMAPEQLAGREVSIRSDLYALGLVLYELFTGKAAYKASTPAELAKLHQESAPTSPTSLVSGMDPAVERAILRCLEKDPRGRPASALAVSASLPGGDPLAAALEAGETPSPEMVAAAGEEGSVVPALGLIGLVAVLIGIAVVAFAYGQWGLHGMVPLDKPPQVLAEKAREIVEALGYDEPPADTARGFTRHEIYLNQIQQNDRSVDRWEAIRKAQPAAVSFWYRQSPDTLIPRVLFGSVEANDPPLGQEAEGVLARVDLTGRLMTLIVTPPRIEPDRADSGTPDWNKVLGLAGLDPDDLRPVPPEWNPPVYCETVVAWEGEFPDRPEVPLRAEAGSYGGRVSYFTIVEPWDRTAVLEPESLEGGSDWIDYVVLAMIGAILGGAVFLAVRNVRMGRGDARGARRLAVFVFVIVLVGDLIYRDHYPLFEEIVAIFLTVALALLLTAITWVMYMALEPYVRRRWPQSLISWTRLLSGRLRDPRVGRDLLIGTIVGTGFSVLSLLSFRAPVWFGEPPTIPFGPPLGALLGPGRSLGQVFGIAQNALIASMGLLLLFVLFRLILRRPWLATGGFLVFLTLVAALQSPDPWIDFPFALAIWLLVVIVIVRYGLLALTAIFVTSNLLMQFPATTDFSAWYSTPALLGILCVVALAGYGFWVSLGGRQLIRDEVLDGS
jgi:serine/threonine-protein kinase